MLINEFVHRSRHGFCCDYQAIKWLIEMSPESVIEKNFGIGGNVNYSARHKVGDKSFSFTAFVGD